MGTNFNCISKAILSLYKSTKQSELRDNEKNILKQLIEKVAIYYTNEFKVINEFPENYDYSIKMNRLISRITDYIVAINDTIKGKNDVQCVVNMIYKEINYNPQKGHFKRKRLIR